MKKQISIFLSMALTLTAFSFTIAKADTNKTSVNDIPIKPITANNSKSNKTVINEYEVIQSLKNKSDDELKLMKFNDNDIKRLRNLDYDQELMKKSKLSETQLKNLGYTDSQINIFKNLNNSNSSNLLKSFSSASSPTSLTATTRLALSSTCTVSSDKIEGEYYTSLNETEYGVEFWFTWSSQPIFMNIDTLGAAWNNGLYIDQGRSYLNVCYYSSITGNRDTYTHCILDTSTINGGMLSGSVATNFPMSINQTDANTYDWAKYGYGHLYLWTRDGKYNNEEARFAYSHMLYYNPFNKIALSVAKGPLSFSPGGWNYEIESVSDNIYSLNYIQ